jgi:hypothetical protein
MQLPGLGAIKIQPVHRPMRPFGRFQMLNNTTTQILHNISVSEVTSAACACGHNGKGVKRDTRKSQLADKLIE